MALVCPTDGCGRKAFEKKTHPVYTKRSAEIFEKTRRLNTFKRLKKQEEDKDKLLLSEVLNTFYSHRFFTFFQMWEQDLPKKSSQLTPLV